MKRWLAARLRAWLAPELTDAQRIYDVQIGMDFASEYIAWRQGGTTSDHAINENGAAALEWNRQCRAHVKATGTIHGFAPDWRRIRYAPTAHLEANRNSTQRK